MEHYTLLCRLGAPYSMAFNPHTNTIYSYSPKTGYVNSDFLLETQSLSSPNPNLVTSYVCNTAVGPLGVGPIDGVQLLWDDFTNTLLAVTVSSSELMIASWMIDMSLLSHDCCCCVLCCVTENT